MLHLAKKILIHMQNPVCTFVMYKQIEYLLKHKAYNK